MKNLKKYQEKAVDELFEHSAKALKEDKKSTIIFKAPTGSGKTFMMSKLLERIKAIDSQNLCFIWATIGKGSLHEQTYYSLDKTLYGVRLLDRDFQGGRRYIDEGDIVVLNWEKIRSKNKDGEWTNTLMKDKEQCNFRDVVRNTKEEQNRKIVLIIDESHASAKTDVANEIRQNIIDPDITIEMSATPILNDYDHKVQVEPNDVILEEMIKKEIVINPEIDKIADDDLDSSNFILECAYRKLQELKALYKSLDINVNPLCLVQLPTSADGDMKRKITEEFLYKKGISVKNRNLAIWLSEEKVHNEKAFLNQNSSEVDFLIFKQAIDTGWDCPRAQVLIRFRETKSISFEIQTVGRILRMPEAKHYSDDNLNKAYIYTNIQSIQVKKEEYSPNIIKSCYSQRKHEIYSKTLLRSYYQHRLDFGDITSSIRPILDQTFCESFGIKVGEYNFFQENEKKLEAEGVNLKNLVGENDEILLNETLDVDRLDLEQEIKGHSNNVFQVKLSENDKIARFNQIIADNIKGYAFKRSFSNVQNALYNWFMQYLGLQNKENAMPYIQSIVLNNKTVFDILLNKTIEKYEPIKKDETKKKVDDVNNWSDDWEIPYSKNFNEHTHALVQCSLCLYEPAYLKLNKLEKAFVELLDNSSKKVLWWWQNGSEHMQENFGIKYEKDDESRTFQPDFLVMFKNGQLGIFDTKASGEREDDNLVKSNALQRYIAEENTKDKNLIGGLVIKANGKFRINRKSDYKRYKPPTVDWEHFEDLVGSI